MTSDTYHRFAVELRSELRRKATAGGVDGIELSRLVARRKARRRVVALAAAASLAVALTAGLGLSGTVIGENIVVRENRLFVEGLVDRSLFEGALVDVTLAASTWFEPTAIVESVDPQ
jgi:hypothetical protein